MTHSNHILIRVHFCWLVTLEGNPEPRKRQKVAMGYQGDHFCWKGRGGPVLGRRDLQEGGVGVEGFGLGVPSYGRLPKVGP